MMTPLQCVQLQFEAYNARDLPRFLSAFSEDISGFRLPDMTPLLAGKAAYGDFYAKERFVHAGLRAELGMRLFGERQALYRTNELTQEYYTNFDKQNGNLDEFISTAIAEDLQQYGDNEYFMGGYQPQMETFRGKIAGQHTADVSQLAVENAKGGVYDVFLGNAKQMLADGRPPEEIVTDLRGRMAGNADLLNIPLHEQDAEWLAVAEQFANEGNLDMVNAMLAPISEDRRFAAGAAKVLSVATAKREELNRQASLTAMTYFDGLAQAGTLNDEELFTFHKENPGVYTEAGVVALVRQSQNNLVQAQQAAATAADKAALETQAWRDKIDLRGQNLQLVESGRVPFLEAGTVRNEKGEPIQVTVQEQQKWLAEDIVEQVNAIADDQGLDEGGKLSLMAGQFTMAGIENPQWQQLLSAGSVAGHAWSLSGEPPPQLVEGAKLYTQLHAQSPMLLSRHIQDEEVKRFYETYRTAVQLGGMDESQALSHAANIVRSPPISNPMTSLKKEDLEGIVRDIGDGGGGWFGIGKGTANNEAIVSDFITRRQAEYGAMGTMTGKAAGEEAKKDFLNSHVAVNGQWVPTNDRHIPPNFEELAKTVIEDYVRDFPDELDGLDADELTLAPATNGSGVWMLVYKGGVPYPVENVQRRYITLQSMQQAVDARTQAKLEELQNTQQTNQGAALDTVRTDQLLTEQATQGLAPTQQGILQQLGTTGSLLNN
ncbi:hypothetical protein N8A98_20700 [Devosia neptuniae]|uniref:Uncharacterized protein n=1 Tax=Devosia neptuniae TaxID=191302 RepID=A0ABY6CF39_9HYPH|nr:hypothetical protein [Devosia neptuniae]UXN69611.1 hypothetical protein N8A98_20700 [Devosia neptuniae]